jgi:hypothetical protein
LGDDAAQGNTEDIDAVVAECVECVECALDRAGDAGHAPWPTVGRGLAHSGRVEADHLDVAPRQLTFERRREIEAGAEPGDEEQRLAGAPHRGTQPHPVDVDEPDDRIRCGRRHR